METLIVPFLEATVRTATPLALAALGETVTERAGVINIGLEGCMIVGAFAALLGAGTSGVVGGFVGAALGGAFVAAVFAFFVIALHANQIIAGAAVTIGGLGLTGALYQSLYGASGAALATATAGPVPIPGLASLPLIGRALFHQPASTYLLYVLVPLVWWWLFRTGGGLSVRGVGERPEAAVAAGVNVQLIRWGAILFGGVLGGIAGGTLVIVQTGTFAEGMTAGRGFIAVAVVVLGRWNPVGAAVAALLFGAASAVQFLFQAMGWAVAYQLFLATPYVLTLILLATTGGRAAAPAALGREAPN